MKRLMLVRTWCENTEEGINYLKYNGYGTKIKRISNELFLCAGSIDHKELRDVSIIKII